MKPSEIAPESTVFVILSLEEPDEYSRAGGLGVRVADLSEALAEQGYETHLLFVGDRSLPGHEILADGKLHLHHWCQWISRYHRAGVYQGETEKLNDFADVARESSSSQAADSASIVLASQFRGQGWTPRNR